MNITILGAGFAALTAIKETRKHSPQANIRVIAPKQRFFYFPSMIWIPSGLRKADDLWLDLTNYCNKYKVEFVEARVTAVSQQGRTVETDKGDYENDGLIIASGATFIRDIDGIDNAGIICQGAEVAEDLKARLESLQSGTIAIGLAANPQEPSATRGAGPVLEFVLGIEQLLRQQKRRDNFQIIFFSPDAEPTAQFSQKSADALLKMLQERQIEVLFEQQLKGFSAGKVEFADRSIDADIILFQSGISGADWVQNSDIAKSAGGLIAADEHAKVNGWDKTYVAGDGGSFPGPDWQPKLGLAAEIQAKTAAHNLVNELNGGGKTAKSISHKLVYLIDTLDGGIVLKRTQKGSKIIPRKFFFHHAKRLLEWVSLRKIR